MSGAFATGDNFKNHHLYQYNPAGYCSWSPDWREFSGVSPAGRH